MAEKVLVVTTSDRPEAAVRKLVAEHAGAEAEVHVVAPASKISWLDRLTNAEDDARAEAARRAETASEEIPREAEPHVGDVDPLQAIEDALRMFHPDEVIVVTSPEESASWLEDDLAERARERFGVPVTQIAA